jgi:hypothetical protein
VAVKNIDQCGNPSFYERFLTLYFNNYGLYLLRDRGSLSRIWVKAMRNVRRSGLRSRLRVGARERRELVKGCERESGWAQ